MNFLNFLRENEFNFKSTSGCRKAIKRVGELTIISFMKKRINLDALKVKSFVTSMKSNRVNTVKGGAIGSHERKIDFNTMNIDNCAHDSNACYTDYKCRDTGSTSVLD